MSQTLSDALLQAAGQIVAGLFALAAVYLVTADMLDQPIRVRIRWRRR